MAQFYQNAAGISNGTRKHKNTLKTQKYIVLNKPGALIGTNKVLLIVRMLNALELRCMRVA